MYEGEMAVARFRDGKRVKGCVRDFSIDSDLVVLEDEQTSKERRVSIDELKAVFFVKSFMGTSEYVEKKIFGIRKNIGKKVFVKFFDNESLIGFIDGVVPWDKGFSLSKLGEKAKGFFLTPVDGDSNNDKVFVIASSIKDIQIIV